MGVFDRIFSPEDAPASPDAPSAPGWSEEKQARWGRLFSGPLDALEALQKVGEQLLARRDPAQAGLPPKQVFGADAVEQLQSYAVAAQALKPERGEVAARPALYRRLGALLQEHLEAIPEVTAYRLTGGYLRAIAQDLGDAEAEDLVAAGTALRMAMREIRKARRAPALERRDDLGHGTTTSLSEQFRAHYASGAPEDDGPAPAPPSAPPLEPTTSDPPAPAEPLEPEEPLPPATDLNAEAVFRLLLEECLRDGKISRAEARAIAQLRDLLGLSLRRHHAMLEEVSAATRAKGPDNSAEELDPVAFFERCCRTAMADGVVEGAEKELLQRVGRYLHITPEEYASIRARMAGR